MRHTTHAARNFVRREQAAVRNHVPSPKTAQTLPERPGRLVKNGQTVKEKPFAFRLVDHVPPEDRPESVEVVDPREVAELDRMLFGSERTRMVGEAEDPFFELGRYRLDHAES